MYSIPYTLLSQIGYADKFCHTSKPVGGFWILMSYSGWNGKMKVFHEGLGLGILRLGLGVRLGLGLGFRVRVLG